MQKLNFDKIMQEHVKEFQENHNRKPKLLLHVCCAPCSSYCIETLSEDFDIILDFYNPNIATIEEFEKRLGELKRLKEEMPQAHESLIVSSPYDHEHFLEMAAGYEEEPERGKRCILCYKDRLNEACRRAKEVGADFFTTTLTISPQKDSQIINRIGMAIGEKNGVKYLPSDFKKRGGYLRSIELSKDYNLYRQNFCGCEFSKNKEKKEG